MFQKFILSLFIIFIMSSIHNISFAQSSKEINKRTKKELKQYLKNPQSYRRMIKNQKDEVELLNAEIESIREDFEKADYLRSLYYDSLSALNYKIDSLSGKNKPINIDELNGNKNIATNSGVEYRVQIGAYKLFDITKLLKYDQPIGYGKENELIYYFFGSWEDPIEAYKHTEIIRKNDVKDAFVVKFVDGRKVPYDYFKDPNVNP